MHARSDLEPRRIAPRLVAGAALAMMTAALGGLAALAPAAAQDTVEFGGGGGSRAVLPCPAGSWLAGLDIWQGDVIDAVQPYCARASRFGDLEPAVSASGRQGGAGGGLVRLRCEQALSPDHGNVRRGVVAGLTVRTLPYPDITVVADLTLHCIEPKGGATWDSRSSWHDDDWRPPAMQERRLDCPAVPNLIGRHHANTLVVQTGNLVDRIGFACAPLAIDRPIITPPVTTTPTAPRAPAGSSPGGVFTGPPGGVAGLPVDRAAMCDAYATRAVETVLVLFGQCGVGLAGAGRHTDDYNVHRNWCLTAPDDWVRNEASIRDQEVAACRTCEGYTERTLAQFVQKDSCRQPVGGPFWTPNPRGTHFHWCFAEGPDGVYRTNPDAATHEATRARDLEMCMYRGLQ